MTRRLLDLITDAFLAALEELDPRAREFTLAAPRDWWPATKFPSPEVVRVAEYTLTIEPDPLVTARVYH